MDKRFLLDSNLISELSKPQPNANVLTNIQRFEPLCAISAITLQEALFGIELLPDGSRKNRLKEYVEIVKQKFDVISYDATAASYYAEVVAKRFRTYRKNHSPKIGELVRSLNILL